MGQNENNLKLGIPYQDKWNISGTTTAMKTKQNLLALNQRLLQLV
jgi:hypothetical protein